MTEVETEHDQPRPVISSSNIIDSCDINRFPATAHSAPSSIELHSILSLNNTKLANMSLDNTKLANMIISSWEKTK